MGTARPRRRLGRPPLSEMGASNLSSLAERRAEILDAATNVFLEHGYERATLSKIIDRVGGSNRTLYAMFGDKAGLFTAVVEHVSAKKMLMHGALEKSHASLEEALLMVGRELCTLSMSSLSLQLHRILIASMDRFPDMGVRIYQAVAAPTLAVLIEIFQHHSNDYVYRLRYIDMAKLFVAIMQRDFERRIMKVMVDKMSQEEADTFIRDGVDFFIAGAILPRKNGN